MCKNTVSLLMLELEEEIAETSLSGFCKMNNRVLITEKFYSFNLKKLTFANKNLRHQLG